MLHTSISNQAINKPALKRFTLGQSHYISRIAFFSYGTYGTLCRKTPKLNHSNTTRYDFLETIEFAFKNFVCNQMNEDVIYKTSYEAWNDFVSHLPEKTEGKILHFTFIKNNSSDDSLKPIYAMTCTEHDENLAEKDIEAEILKGKNQVFSIQISEYQANRLDSTCFEIQWEDLQEYAQNNAFDLSLH